MPIGVSYFGNRILRHVAADMDDLAARGFTGVLHTMSENDLAYYRDTLGRIVEISHAAGLFVQVGPWGLGRTFGGEAESLFVANHPHVGQVLDSGRPGGRRLPQLRGLPGVRALLGRGRGGDRRRPDLLGRAPLGPPRPLRRAPRAVGLPLRPLRAALVRRDRRRRHADRAHRRRAGLPGALPGRVPRRADRLRGQPRRPRAPSACCPTPAARSAWPTGRPWPVSPGVATLATDPYWKAFDEPVVPFVTEFSERVAQQAAAAGIEPQIWIQGFRLGPEDADDIHAAVAAARAAGVDDLWTWGYEACGHMSYLGTRDPERVWEILCAALTTPTDRPEPAFLTAPDTVLRNARTASGALHPPRCRDLGGLVTERVRPELADLDLRPTQELVRLMASEEAAVAAAVRAGGAGHRRRHRRHRRPAHRAARRSNRLRRRRDGRAHGRPRRRRVRPDLQRRRHVRRPHGRRPAAPSRNRRRAPRTTPPPAPPSSPALGVGPADAVVGISASGRTPYVLGALGAAREAGALTVGLSCHPGSLVSGRRRPCRRGRRRPRGHRRLHPPEGRRGPEARAQHDLHRRDGPSRPHVREPDGRRSAGSEKLVDRARRIVVTATGCTPAEAAAALEAADGEVKTAIVALLAGVDAATARHRLARSGGVVRRALSAP